MIVVGIKGFIGAGKTTVARHLVENHGFVRGRIAGALKAMTRALLSYRGVPADMIERMIDGDLKENPSIYLGGKSPREAMESLGIKWGREDIHPDLWVDAEHDKLLITRPSRVVIEDIRHVNEEVFVRQMLGRVWDIYRPGLVPKDQPTERAQLEVRADEILCNEIGALDRTLAAVDVLVERLVAIETAINNAARIGLPPMQEQPR